MIFVILIIPSLSAARISKDFTWKHFNMSKKLKIGISFSTTNFANYWNWFSHEDLGDEFELVELSFLKNNKADFDACEGFVLTGGTDIEPSTYNGSSSYEFMPEEFLVERDQFEEK